MNEIKNFLEKPNFDKEKLLNPNSDYPKISIVIPSYNQGQYIEYTILSILNQNYPNLELIIIDGGSQDETLNIIRSYNQYISYWVSEKDNGQSHALNKGFSVANGNIFGWQNADDVYLPNTFTSVVKTFDNNPEKEIVYGDHYILNSNNEIIGKQLAIDFNLKHLIYEGILFNAQTMFWKRGVHERFGGFDESLQYTMDYDMMISMGISEGKERFIRVSTPLAAWRRHAQQKCNKKNEKNHKREHSKLSEKYGYDHFGSFIFKLFFRLRRVYLYIRRGEISFLYIKFKKKINYFNRRIILL